MDRQRVRAQLDRILASTAFAGAERPSTFLRFVVERALEGRIEQIKESVIAVEAFKRNASFDPRSDPIVRVEAGRLRDRLKAYYEQEGETDVLVIDLPKGRYVPRFTERTSCPRKPVDVLKLSSVPPGDSPVDSFAVWPDGRALAVTASLRGSKEF